MNLRPWLILSAVLNAVLGVALLVRALAGGAGQDRSGASVNNSNAGAARTITVPGPSHVSGGGVSVPTVSETSESAAAASAVKLASLAAQLRTAGVSEEVIGDVISSVVNREFMDEQRERQRKARRGEIDPRTSWQQSPERQAAREQAIRSAMGEDAYIRWDKHNVLGWMDTESLNLSPTESDTLYQFQKDQQKQMQALYRQQQLGELDPTDFQKVQQDLTKANEKRLADLLGPDRAGKMKQSGDWSLGQLRWDLREANIADTQIDALARAQQQANERQQELQRLAQAGTPVDGSKWQELQTAKEQSYQSILGPQGYAAYQKTQDNAYRQLKQYAKAWQLNPGDVEDLYQTLQSNKQALTDYRKQAQDLQAQGQPVNWNDVNQGAEDFKKQADAALRAKLGEDRYNKLKRAGVIQIN